MKSRSKPPAMGYVKYDSNNSGGSWWLKDEHWKALEAAGWVIHWKHLRTEYTPDGDYVRDERGLPKLTDKPDPHPKWSWDLDIGKPGARWLGALATEAWKPNCNDLRAAVEEWERITGLSSTDAGCACCGPPHTFTLYDSEGNYVKSGPEARYVASWS